jgi:nitroimidazol reductase NimA-like FMN-containing flavoprotein (pyridoxamine 5'-phosphate oxidase superfamily)
MPFDDGLVRLSRQECLALLASESFGRVGVSVEALPAILPVTIALMDESVVFRTIPGTKLAYATKGSILAVEADQYDAALGDGWSVLVRGVASELVDAGDIGRARELLADSWINGHTAEHYVGVSCDLVTGRRLHHQLAGQQEG